MLIFGPYDVLRKIIDENNRFMVFNLSSQTQDVSRLPGLMINVTGPINDEKEFDIWYYDYIMNNQIPFSSLMTVLMNVYEGFNVYVCIGEYSYDRVISMINESFMKVIQQRYDIKYYIINSAEDYYSIVNGNDGCVFNSIEGIMNFDKDKEQFILMQTELGIINR